MSWTEKQALRREVRARFPGQEARLRESALICRHVLDWPVYRDAGVIAGYMPLPWEADVTPILEDALASGKTLLLPRVEDDCRMTLRRVERLDRLVANRWGLAEPPEDAETVPASDVRLMLVPLEAIDEAGMRLGKGGGYYDRLLRDTGATSLGIALSWQRVARVPADAWDQPLEAAADADGIRLFRRNERTMDDPASGSSK